MQCSWLSSGRGTSKAKRTILDAVRNHIIPHVSGKDFAFQMWQSLCGHYQSPNQNLKMVLQEKLRGTKMTKIDSITSFLTIFSQIRDELAAMGEIVDPSELERTTLMAFPNLGRALYEALCLESICPVGRGSGMTLYKRSLELALDPLVNSVVGMMRVIFLFWQRERRRPRRVPRVGPSSNKEEVSNKGI
jgi:hypothetical protein